MTNLPNNMYELEIKTFGLGSTISFYDQLIEIKKSAGCTVWPSCCLLQPKLFNLK